MGTQVAIGIQGSESRGTAEAPWVRAHHELSRLAKTRAALDAEEGRWLLSALREGTHVHLGFGSFGEYVETLFGYRPRSTEEKVRVAEALEQLPQTAAALREGRLGWSAVRELTRVVTPNTEGEWLSAAKGRTARQVEALVLRRSPGDTPNSPANRTEQRHVLRFEVSAETLALFREAIAKLRRSSGDEKLEDDAALLLIARQVLGGPSDDGRASYQIAVTTCEHCRRGFQRANGELVDLAPEIVEMAECDAQHLGNVGALSANADMRANATARAHACAHVGGRVSAGRADVQAKVFSALRQMGYREGEARQALTRLHGSGKADASLEQVLREALRLLRTC